MKIQKHRKKFLASTHCARKQLSYLFIGICLDDQFLRNEQAVFVKSMFFIDERTQLKVFYSSSIYPASFAKSSSDIWTERYSCCKQRDDCEN